MTAPTPDASTPIDPPDSAGVAREESGEEDSVTVLAQQGVAYARAWAHLAASEASLAKVQFPRLLLLALIVPALALAIFLLADVLLIVLLYRLFATWSLALLLALAVNIAGLATTWWTLRRWWRTLSLPRSRAALAQFMEGLRS